MGSAQVVLTALDPRYPSRLRELPTPPASIVVEGGSLDAPFTVAVVGSRDAAKGATDFAGELATALATAGAVVVSGGARGVDGAAHRAALGCGGRTWVVAGTDPEGCFPAEHDLLFRAVASGPGAMVWPFVEPVIPRLGFPARNRILVALADVVVVVQAGARSGALSAARWARKLGKPLWVVPVPPWETGAFDGSRQLLEQGAHPLVRLAPFLDDIRVREAVAPSPVLASLNPHEIKVLSAMSDVPRHLDAITERAHLATHTASAALLTLALENVVVEGPPGFFRRRNAT
jgi:DNA processing protein